MQFARGLNMGLNKSDWIRSNVENFMATAATSFQAYLRSLELDWVSQRSDFADCHFNHIPWLKPSWWFHAEADPYAMINDLSSISSKS
jgi:hypothetical protein